MAKDIKQEIRSSIYLISSPRNFNNHEQDQSITKSLIEKVVLSLNLVGKWHTTKTECGIIVSFTSEEDADRLMCWDLASTLGGPVQISRFNMNDKTYRQVMLLCDVPYPIALQDIIKALSHQGISIGKVERIHQHVKIEVLSAEDFTFLLQQGLNFFGIAQFAALPERWWHANSSCTMGSVISKIAGVPKRPDSLVQCYRCQGFWHIAANCRHLPRCVRCGETHNMEFCPRPRHNPICCNCLGPHHAAYRNCPVRLQLLNSVPVSITLSSSALNINKQLWSS